MKSQKFTLKTRPLITRAIFSSNHLWSSIEWRNLPPIALLGVAALMLRNVSFKALADTIAPALRRMAEIANKETLLDLEDFTEEDGPYTFELWLAGFEFDAFDDRQPQTWEPFLKALEQLPGGGDIKAFREHIVSKDRNVGMLLWLTLHAVFDELRNGWRDVDDLEPENRWLAALPPTDWRETPRHWSEPREDAVGIVLAHLYNEARKNWEWPSEPAPERSDLTEHFLMPPLPTPIAMDDID